MKLFFNKYWSIAITMIILGCIPREPSHEGVYHMDDLIKMKEFVGYPRTPGYAYCLEFQPSKKLARVRFLEGPEVYPLKLERISKEDYLLKGPRGYRKAKVKPEYSELTGWVVYFNFEDSNPYKPGPNIPDDGVKEPSFKTLDDCVQAQLNHIQEAEEQSYHSPEKIEGNVAH